MKLFKKILKWLMISIGTLFAIIITLAIIYNQLTFALLSGIGSMDLYSGNNERGNKIITYAISKIETPSAETYHAISVQNTKNGNYNVAIPALEKAIKLNPEEGTAYYGWVLLYYYHDYEKSLEILEQCDAYTPNFSDAPMGTDIHYLKGLCHMQLQHYQKAVDEFNIYIHNFATTHGEDFVDVYTFVQKGRCLTQLGQFEQAINSYNKAIKYYDNCTEAYYFMGLTQLKINEKENACNSFNTALNLIQKGHKSADTYVEYFHEIYPQQIEESIMKSCN
jgi:tetratricopeptide (TPR) repeat protein